MDVSVVIVSHGDAALLGPCLEAVGPAVGSLECETIVVANIPGSTAAQVPAGTQLIHNAVPRGFAANVNLAMTRASGRFRLLINPDTTLGPSTVARLVDEIEARSDVAAAGPRQLDADGCPVPSARSFPTVPAVAFRGLHLERLFGQPAFYRRYIELPPGAGPVGWVNGACMLIRAAAWNDVGPFHEPYRLYYEEIDWCDRATRRGWRIWFDPAITVGHLARRTSARFPPGLLTAVHSASIARYFARRWSGRLDP